MALFIRKRRREKASLAKPALSERGWCEPSAQAVRQPLWSVPQGAGRLIPVTGWLEMSPCLTGG